MDFPSLLLIRDARENADLITALEQYKTQYVNWGLPDRVREIQEIITRLLGTSPNAVVDLPPHML